MYIKCHIDYYVRKKVMVKSNSYSGLVLGHKWPIWRMHFPYDFRVDLYVFEFRRSRKMGSDEELIQNANFDRVY